MLIGMAGGSFISGYIGGVVNGLVQGILINVINKEVTVMRVYFMVHNWGKHT